MAIERYDGRSYVGTPYQVRHCLDMMEYLQYLYLDELIQEAFRRLKRCENYPVRYNNVRTVILVECKSSFRSQD